MVVLNFLLFFFIRITNFEPVTQLKSLKSNYFGRCIVKLTDDENVVIDYNSLHPSGNSSQASYIYLNFWAFENPPPQGISNPFHGGSMNIFWKYTIRNKWNENHVLSLLDNSH